MRSALTIILVIRKCPVVSAGLANVATTLTFLDRATVTDALASANSVSLTRKDSVVTSVRRVSSATPSPSSVRLACAICWAVTHQLKVHQSATARQVSALVCPTSRACPVTVVPLTTGKLHRVKDARLAIDPVGSRATQCNEFDGQCECRDGFGGRRCDQCRANYWGNPADNSCKPCLCDSLGSATQQCDHQTGACVCLPGMGGDKCDRCARGYVGTRVPDCQPCGECFDNWDRILQVKIKL